MSRFYRRELRFGHQSENEITAHKIHLFLDLAHPFAGKSEEEIMRRYRFPPNVILQITDMLKGDLERPTKRSRALPPLYQVVIGLRYVATNSFQLVVGDTVRISQACAFAAVHRFLHALVKHLNRFVKFPAAEQLDNIKDNFYELAEFPGVVGLVDGTHVRIIPPAADKQCYMNHKKFPSINTMCVCDHQGKFTHVCANWAGGTHDAGVYSKSNLPAMMDTLPANCWLLGDLGYACTRTLLTPYENCGEFQWKKMYNKSHRKTRVLIEQGYGRWKRRFSILHSCIRLRTPRACSLVIVCCAILHNLALDHQLGDVDFGEYLEDDIVATVIEGASREGVRFRDSIARRFFSG